MELTVSQKIELQLAVAARVKEFEQFNQDDKYVREALAENRELLEIIRNTMAIEVEFYSAYDPSPHRGADYEVVAA
ncbi:hypothetical protein [Nonomuraea jabiensis]|uniref:hypothetical protein n=1 Tax=Nonomuraea jabiensis TaxID=882448 RepID=UPI003D708045